MLPWVFQKQFGYDNQFVLGDRKMSTLFPMKWTMGINNLGVTFRFCHTMGSLYQEQSLLLFDVSFECLNWCLTNSRFKRCLTDVYFKKERKVFKIYSISCIQWEDSNLVSCSCCMRSDSKKQGRDGLELTGIVYCALGKEAFRWDCRGLHSHPSKLSLVMTYSFHVPQDSFLPSCALVFTKIKILFLSNKGRLFSQLLLIKSKIICIF